MQKKRDMYYTKVPKEINLSEAVVVIDYSNVNPWSDFMPTFKLG